MVAVAWVSIPTHGQAPAAPAAPTTDLDRFMEQVLANREVTWTHLRDYVLDERERFALTGTDGATIVGEDREYTWYARDGIGIRSPVRANGVAVPEADRAKAEAEWLSSERKREQRRRERATARGSAAPSPTGSTRSPDRSAGLDNAPTITPSLEPRFLSEAFFLQFRFEPGNYYVAGRDVAEGRPVIKVEYLPTRLFADDTPSDDPDEIELERKFNKVAIVTLWVDVEARQIVRYTFDNVEFSFMPGRALFRVDAARASMTMTRVFDGLWMPQTISMNGAATLATGTFRLRYDRLFSGYRRGETTATIRMPGEDRPR